MVSSNLFSIKVKFGWIICHLHLIYCGMTTTCATSQKRKQRKEKTIVYGIVKCGVYTRLVNSWIWNFISKKCAKIPSSECLRKKCWLWAYDFNKPYLWFKGSNVTQEWYTSCNVAPPTPIDCWFSPHKFSLLSWHSDMFWLST